MTELIDKWKVVDMLTALENEFQHYKPFHGFEHAMYRKLCDVEMEIGKMVAVHSDWYERLENLDYNYDPVKDGTPWYRAEDVWACIEEIPDSHREFGAHMDEQLELRTCYCPLCDKHFEVCSNDSMGDCPDCGHHVVLHRMEVDE
jgi:hypothetical protein